MSASQDTTFQLAKQTEDRRFTFRPGDDGPKPATEKYRPRTLAEMVGQGAVVWRLQEFLEAPYSGALLMEGETGTGKTTAALCLAAELGAVEFGGMFRIKSGMQDAEAVGKVLDVLRFTPMLGSGWKVVIVDEADNMSPKAAQMWLSALEDLPPRSVIVFTTNHPDKFPQRFLDRCERITFESCPDLLWQDAQAIADMIWKAEGRSGDPPPAHMLRGVVDKAGHLSFRRIVQAAALGQIESPRPTSARPAQSRPDAPADVTERRRAAARKAVETRRQRAAMTA